MVKHLTERYKAVGAGGEMARMMAMTLPEFARVSSFTHGGPYASKLMRLAAAQDTIKADIENKLGIGLTMIGVTKENSLVVYELDGTFLPLLQEFQAARRIAGETATKER
jgi:hypothetical protein